jgi:hypothetical protein
MRLLVRKTEIFERKHWLRTSPSPPFLLFWFLVKVQVHSESLALQALLAGLATTHGLSPHGAVSCRCLLLLSRVGSRALGTHRSRAGEGVATTCAADIDHASGS